MYEVLPTKQKSSAPRWHQWLRLALLSIIIMSYAGFSAVQEVVRMATAPFALHMDEDFSIGLFLFPPFNLGPGLLLIALLSRWVAGIRFSLRASGCGCLFFPFSYLFAGIIIGGVLYEFLRATGLGGPEILIDYAGPGSGMIYPLKAWLWWMGTTVGCIGCMMLVDRKHAQS